MSRANLAGTCKWTKNQPKSSNIQTYSYAHHSDLDKSADVNDVFINEGTTSVADFIVV
jgi:hypothetical protein